MILALALFLAGFQLMNAIPAYPGKYVYTQPDGKRIVLQRHGDEFHHWTTDAAGRMVRLDADGFYREVSEETVSEARRNAAARRSAAQQARVAKAGAPAVKGQRHFLVILVEFSDLAYTTCENPNADFSALLNENGYSVNGGTGSARDYFYENSNGGFEPIFDVYGPVTLSQTKAYYGGNDAYGDDKRPWEALIDGCQLLDDEIDFSQYDSDGDGEVDMVLMYYAGYGEADSSDSDSIWPHEFSISGAGRSLELDGVKIDTYACTNEKIGINAAGLFARYAVVDPELMLKYLGWVTDSDYLRFEETGVYSISPINTNMVYRTDTDMDGEYFLYENRTKSGWDKYIPEEGLIVYHVDKSSRRVGWNTAANLWANWEMTNAINCTGSHPCYYVVPAADQSSLCYVRTSGGVETEKAGIAFPYKSINTYVPVSWNGVEGIITFRQITFKNGELTLKAVAPTGEVDYVTIADAGSYRAGDRFTFELVCPEGVDAPVSVVWYYDDEPVLADSVTLTAGSHTVEAQLTNADGSRGVLTLEITVK